MPKSERFYERLLGSILDEEGIRYERGSGARHPYFLVEGKHKVFFPGSGQVNGSAPRNAVSQLRRLIRKMKEVDSQAR